MLKNNEIKNLKDIYIAIAERVKLDVVAAGYCNSFKDFLPITEGKCLFCKKDIILEDFTKKFHINCYLYRGVCQECSEKIFKENNNDFNNKILNMKFNWLPDDLYKKFFKEIEEEEEIKDI